MTAMSLPIQPAIVGASFLAASLPGVEYHVDPRGDDAASGAVTTPLRTVQRAADLAQPGDTITVHAGTYRERVAPPRGGTADDRRITYRAAPGETVTITGAEVVTGWTRTQGEVWEVTLPTAMFGGFNPYTDVIHGDWFNPKGRTHHTGAVFCEGAWLREAASLNEIFTPVEGEPRWYATVTRAGTTLWAQFPGQDPNRGQVEITVRQSVFYPDRPGCDFITVRGFTLRAAATPWAPPTAEQIGLIGTHWSRGWIIEDNVISHAACCGVTLGKYGDRFDNTSANSAEGYVATVERALAHPIPWDRDHIGHHVVRRNRISHCEQGGIVGSLGGAFSTIADNDIHDIHVRRAFEGAEQSAIKLHGAIDTVISGNHLYRSHRGLWLDWMAQGTRASGNLFHDNYDQDLFLEVNHGPCVIDGNVFLSPLAVLDWSEGTAFVHNLFAGKIVCHPEPRRQTPYHAAHATAIAGLASITGGDNRFFNNLFIANPTPLTNPWYISYMNRDAKPGCSDGLTGYDIAAGLPWQAAGNVFCHGAVPSKIEQDALVLPDLDPGVRMDGAVLRLHLDPKVFAATTEPVTSGRLGLSAIAKAPFVDPQGRELDFSQDPLGRARDPRHPEPGPFARASLTDGITWWQRR